MEEFYKGIEGLKSMFEEFKNRRNNELTDRSNLTESETTKKIGDIFYDECAKHLLCDGYFLIGNESDDNNKIRMYLTDIELYYHEEKEGGIKDYVMYHIPERYKNKKNQDGSKYKLKYFDLGTLNFHTSGIDVTFEKCENKEKEGIEDKDTYRASFLIRGYQIKHNNELVIDEKDHPTHIYDDLFSLGFPVSQPLNIKWQYGKIYDYDVCVNRKEPRYNVPDNSQFKWDEQNEKLIKEGKESIDENEKKSGKYFKSGKYYYKKDTRPWRFKVEKLPKDSTKK